MPDMAAHNDAWSLVVPVKRLTVAKSRIALRAEDRADLAIAMAVDTVAAAVTSGLVRLVIVVTDDARAVASLAGPGVVVVADEPDDGLNPALRHGASAAGGGRIAALSADLPALTAADLDVVLSAAAPHVRAVVSDEAGIGTTLLTAASAADFVPAFGTGSFQAHVAEGAVDLTDIAAASVRRDVDTLEGLRDAVRLGVGEATRQVVARLGSHLG
jgi:2-phospho-L-lactate/phosphoenolpyruvate guanylyltransferase